jgi:hypothetical protein
MKGIHKNRNVVIWAGKGKDEKWGFGIRYLLIGV